MGEAIGQALPFGIGVAISPMALIAVVLMLSGGARGNAAAFLAAWVVGLTVLATAVLLIADGVDASTGGEPRTWVSVLKLVLAALLVLLAWRSWSARPGVGDDDELPSWMQKVETANAAAVAGIAIGIACIKPKNLLLTIGAALAIAQTGASAGAQAGAVAVFVLLAALAPGVPVAISLLMPRRAPVILARARVWLVRENDVIVAVLCLVLASKLLGDALVSLTG